MMSTDAPPPKATPAAASLPNDLGTCQQMVRELLVTVAELRTTIDKQQAHIHCLVRMTFGRRSERLTGPTLFEDFASPEARPPAPPEAAKEDRVVKRSGHGRRKHRDDLPREPVEIDLTEAEKTC